MTEGVKASLGESENTGAVSIRRGSIRYSDLCDINKLMKAFKQARRNSHYKPPVQSFDWYSLEYCYLIKRDLINHTYKPDDTTSFSINERGKVRNIEANTVKDRVVNNLLVNEVLTPLTEPYLIYDNGASRKGFGISHARSRLEKHLHDAMLNFGESAVIDVFDLSKYFDSIYAPKLLLMYRKLIADDDIYDLLFHQLTKHNHLDESAVLRAQTLNVFDPRLKGVGIGSVISQNAGIYYPSSFDRWITVVLSNKYYGRYMDDFYVICKNLDEARKYRQLATEYLSSNLYLTVNPKKTQTAKLTHGFKYLKNYYWVSKSGKVFKRQDNDSFRRERRKIKRFKNTKMTNQDIVESYKSWRGNIASNKLNQTRLKRTDLVFRQNYPYLYNSVISK